MRFLRDWLFFVLGCVVLCGFRGTALSLLWSSFDFWDSFFVASFAVFGWCVCGTACFWAVIWTNFLFVVTSGYMRVFGVECVFRSLWIFFVCALGGLMLLWLFVFCLWDFPGVLQWLFCFVVCVAVVGLVCAVCLSVFCFAFFYFVLWLFGLVFVSVLVGDVVVCCSF